MPTPAILLDVQFRHDKAHDHQQYPFNLPAVKSLARQALTFHPKITYFTGENGSGKSTLLEAIAIHLGFNPEGGTRHFHFATRHTHSPLSDFIRIAKYRRPKDGFFLRAESFYNAASYTEDIKLTYGERSLHRQSHGESFWTVIQERFTGGGLYLLDEPEAALSPQRQLALLRRLHQLVQTHSQFIIATHSPIIAAYPDAQIYHFASTGIEPIAYRDTELFQTTAAFIRQPEAMVADILRD